MGLSHRPYIGTFVMGNRQVVRHTPDALVYINGNTSIPGCPKCNSFIDIQKFVTSVSVDAGTDPGAASGGITLSVPPHHLDSFARDAQFVLHPGLEVHIYMRGYFPVSGMYSNFLNAGESDGTFLDDMGMSGSDLNQLLAYPYYHTFHGVVTGVQQNWSPGAQQITLQCGSMLHFWNYHLVSTNASWFGARPDNSQTRSSLLGHNFTGMHPYEIIYTLHNDTAGAAAGISYVMEEKTNRDARSSVTGESLFSMNLKYWERRFARRDIKLRMHGFNGSMFNTAQAAFLSRLKSEELTALIRSRYAVGLEKKPSSILSAAPARIARLLDEAKRLGLDFTSLETQNSDAKSTVNTNIAEMIAFVKDLGQMAQDNSFESTYESKHDVAVKVCEVTGFEFYQDVDGDLVFKPPMYNLDTSSSRVYRLEEIDIISINFDEKEPQATYCTVKGSHFRNLHGHGLQGQWGVQGQYIDYRLVAQFGWRPATVETAYYNDPKSMFFAAINRLDLMNAPVKSASVTIPLRPELRPGYPLYVPYLDCFYYCNSFAHSYVQGGQCTTTLQLNAKRAKFFAPGRPSKAMEGIAAIDLGNPALPPIPLQVDANDGKRKLAGFPNVVMALDPYQLDPTFFFVGADIDNLDSPETLQGLLKMAVDQGVLTADPNQPGYYWMSTDENHIVTYYYDVGADTSKGNQSDKAVPLQQTAQLYLDRRREQARIQKARSEQVAATDLRLAEQQRKIRQLRQDNPNYDDSQDTSTLQELFEERRELQAEFDAATEDVQVGTPGDGTSDLVALLRKVNAAFLRGPAGESFADLNQTSTILDLLANKKASMSDGALPGVYRYYSASHPEPEHQGQPILRVEHKDGKKNIVRDSPLLTTDAAVDEVLTFVSTEGLQSVLNGSPPQAKLEYRKPQWGLKVLTTEAGGKVIPTNRIQELMFAVHSIAGGVKRASTTEGKNLTSTPAGLRAGLQQTFRLACQNAISTDIPQTVFDPVVAEFNELIQSAVQQALAVRDRASGDIGTVEPLPPVVDNYTTEPIDINGRLVDPQQPLNLYGFSDDPRSQDLDAELRQITSGSVTSQFGGRADPIEAQEGNHVVKQHAGTDISAIEGTPINAASEGTVKIAGVVGNYGNAVYLDHGNNLVTIYGHMQSFIVKKGDRVKKGQLIGYVGSTGKSTGNHLHFEIRENGQPVDPRRSRLFQQYPTRTGWIMIADALANRVHDKLLGVQVGNWLKLMKDSGMSAEVQDQVRTAFYQSLLGSYGVASSSAQDNRTGAKAVTNENIQTSPVFPVSDAQGYEVFGTFRYGRGVNIDPTGVFDTLHRIDPFSMLDSKTVQDMVDSLVSEEPLYTEREIRDANGKPTGRFEKVPLTQDVQERAATAFRKNLTDQQILDFGLASNNGNPTLLDFNLSNWIADKSKDGVMKIPLINAGYSLADLDLNAGQNICTCKAAEADVLLAMADQMAFTPLVTSPDQPNARTGDQVTQWVREATHRAIPQWVQSRGAVAGDNVGRTPVSFIQTTETVARDWSQVAEEIRSRAETIRQQIQGLENPLAGN